MHDLVRRVEQAAAVLLIRVVVRRARDRPCSCSGARGARVVVALAELVVVQPAVGVAEVAAPEPVTRLRSWKMPAWYCECAPVDCCMLTLPNCGNGRSSWPRSIVDGVANWPAPATPKNGFGTSCRACRRRQALILRIELVDVDRARCVEPPQLRFAAGRGRCSRAMTLMPPRQLALEVGRVLLHARRALVRIDEADVAAGAGQQAERVAGRLHQAGRERIARS